MRFRRNAVGLYGRRKDAWRCEMGKENEACVCISEIRSVIQSHYPVKAAEDWDNPGLQLGRKEARVSRVLIALELTRAIVDEAIQNGVELIVTHHPFIFKPLKAVTTDSVEGSMLLDLAEHRIALLAAHTNLDSAPDAINARLSDMLGLSERRIFLKQTPFVAYKMIVFVPEASADDVAKAMHEAGAGCVGNYSDVSFVGKGEGRFRCGTDSHPAIGVPGSAECVAEVRLEMVVSARDLGRVTKAMLAAHPYEEPAYDVFKLESDVRGMTDQYGFGMVGTLPETMTLSVFIDHIKKLWDIESVRACGDPEKLIRRVAIMNGAGAKYYNMCSDDVDAYITGDCGHHDFDNANRRGLALIDAGHYDTEKFIPEIIKQVLDKAFEQRLEVIISQCMKRPFCVYS